MPPTARTVTVARRYDPAMMVALLLYAYAIGERSSRADRAACVEDVASRVIAANQAPDHTTIARFRQRHEDGAGRPVRRGARAVRRGRSRRGRGARGRRHEGPRQRVRARDVRLRADRARDARRGRRGRSPRRTSASVSAAATSCPRSWRPARGARSGWPRPSVDWKSAAPQEAKPIPASRRDGCGKPSAAWKRTLRRSAAPTPTMRPTGRAALMRNGRRLGAHPPKPYTPPSAPQGKVNTTDPDSRNVKTPRGWVQGYNAQAATNERQIVIAAELTNSSADFGQIGPMVDAARRELRAAGVAEPRRSCVADAGYWHQVQMQALAADGVQVLIPPDANKRKGARPGWDGGLYAFMRRVLATPTGGRALPQTHRDDRAGLRRHQVQPQDRPLPTPRQSRLPLGMAADHRHPQPPQALARHRPRPPAPEAAARAGRAPRPDPARRASAPSHGDGQPFRNSHHGTR